MAAGMLGQRSVRSADRYRSLASNRCGRSAMIGHFTCLLEVHPASVWRQNCSSTVGVLTVQPVNQASVRRRR